MLLYLLLVNRNVAQQDPSLGRRILNWLNSLLAKLGGKDAQDAAFVRRARDLYAAALRQTEGSFIAQTAKAQAPAQQSSPEAAATAEAATAVQQNTTGINENMSPAEMRQWALDAYNAGQISEQTLDQILDDIDAQEELNGSGISLEAELNRLNQEPAAQHSISPIVGQQDNYGVGVILDTPLFDGVKPRDWGKVLGNYVYQNLAGTELKVYDDAGNEEIIYIAKTTDRVTKDGAKNSHKVIDKLARYRGDNIKALATVHLSELLQTSTHENTTNDNNHQWLDQNGWEYRKTYIQDAKGNIYEAWLNIANGRERNILYEINNVRLIDKANNKRAAHGVVPSTDTGRGSHIKSSSSEAIVTETSDNVNGQHSISAPAERQSVIRNLRSILDRGGDPNELRRYVTRLEQGSQTADRTASISGQEGTEAQRILQTARDRGIGVEEYLKQNWERYDVDGQWNDAARQALELEQGQSRRQHSISVNMPQHERYEILKDKRIAVIIETRTSEYEAELQSLDELKSKAKSKAEKIIIPLADELGITQRPLTANDINFQFLFSKNGGLRESLSKQLRYGGSYTDFAKALINLDRILDGAELIEAHTDKYAGTSRADENLEAVYVLLGAFQDGSDIIPVQMELKKSSDAGGRLYVTVALTKIEADVVGSTPEMAQTRSLLSASMYNLADIVKEIKTEDKHFLKYLPDQMLTQDQVEAKRHAIAEDERRIESFSKVSDQNGKISHFISEAPGTEIDQDIAGDITDENEIDDVRSILPKKARDYLKRTERTLLNSISRNLGVPWFAQREYLQPLVEKISNEYLKNGTVSKETVDRLFDTAYDEGIVVDREFYDQYKDIKDYLPDDVDTNSKFRYYIPKAVI